MSYINTAIDKFFTVLGLTIEFINSIPASSWLVIGSLVGAVILTFTSLNIVKNRHLRKKGEQLSKKLVQLQLAFFSFIYAVAAFIVTHGADLTAFATLAPFLKEYVAPIMSAATFCYHFGANDLYKAITKKLREWAGKKVLEYEKPNIAPERVQTDSTPSSDMFS